MRDIEIPDIGRTDSIKQIINEIDQIAPSISDRALINLAIHLDILRGFRQIDPDPYCVTKIHEYSGAVLALGYYLIDDIPKEEFYKLISFLEHEAECPFYKSDYCNSYEMLPF